MAVKANSFVGISSGTTITTANSGGDSGDAFDRVVGSPTVNTTADLTDAYDRGMITALSSSTESFVQWSITSGTTHYFRRYLRVSAAPPATCRIMRGMNASGATSTTTNIRWEVRLQTDMTLILTNEAGAWVQSTTSAISANTIYRVEVGITSGIGRLRVYAGESTSPLATSDWSDLDTAIAETSYIRFGAITSSAQTYSPQGAAVAWSDTDWLGPATAASTDHTATPSDALGLTDIAAAAKTTVWPVTRNIQIG